MGYIADADSIFLWFPGFRPKTVRSPSQNRMFLVRKPYGFGTENVKERLPETDSIPFDN